MAFWDRIRKRKKRKREQAMAEETHGSARKPEDGSLPENNDTQGEPARLSRKDLETEHIIPKGKAEQKRYIHDCCEAVKDCEKQISIAKTEYTRVTEYLTDIQKIDRIAGKKEIL